MEGPTSSTAKANKSAIVQSWACANFSSIGGEELLRFLNSFSRTCVDIGIMDFRLEPTMLLRMSSPCDNIDVGLWMVRKLFKTEMEKGHTKLLLVILPDTRCSDERIAKSVEEVCKDIRVAYQCCLPQYDRMANKEYLQNTATEIKTKVIELFNNLSDSDDIFDEEMREDDGSDCSEEREDDGYEEVREDDGADYEEMREDDGYLYEEEREDDGTDYEEMRDDDGHNYEEREDDGHDPHNESGDYTYEEKRTEISYISGTPDLEMSGQLLFPADTPMTEGKSANIKTWACVNFSRIIRGKRLFRFLSKLGNMCMSIGMDLSMEPALSIHTQYTDADDVGDTLWTVFEFFRYLKIEKRATLLLVILSEDACDDIVVDTCESLGFVYQLCPCWNARRPSKKYLKNAANKIKAKVQGLSDYCGDMSEDIDPISDKDTGEDGSEKSEDSDEEMGSTGGSNNVLVGGHEISDNHAGSNEEDHSCGTELSGEEGAK